MQGMRGHAFQAREARGLLGGLLHEGLMGGSFSSRLRAHFRQLRQRLLSLCLPLHAPRLRRLQLHSSPSFWGLKPELAARMFF